MELRVFIKKTLKDIIGGVHDAQQEIEQGKIVLLLNEQGWKGLEIGLTSYQAIDFEVSVNAVEQEGSEANVLMKKVFMSFIGNLFKTIGCLS